MRRRFLLVGAACLVATQAHAHARRPERHHHDTAIERLQSEIAALTRKVDRLTQPGNNGWQAPVAIPFNAVASIGAAATQAALEIPERAVIQPIEELADKIGLAADQSYLVATACAGYTMHRQGVALSIERLHPAFRRRLAAAFRDARAHAMHPCIYSAYRPPGYGVGGFRDKFYSAHAYGLAVDLGGIGRPGSGVTLRWRAIAAAHGIIGPYSAYSRAEWNHFQATPARMVTFAARGLRATITARGPISLAKMWRLADAIIPGPGQRIVVPRIARLPHALHRNHYVLRPRRHVAYLQTAWPQWKPQQWAKR